MAQAGYENIDSNYSHKSGSNSIYKKVYYSNYGENEITETQRFNL